MAVIPDRGPHQKNVFLQSNIRTFCKMFRHSKTLHLNNLHFPFSPEVNLNKKLIFILLFHFNHKRMWVIFIYTAGFTTYLDGTVFQFKSRAEYSQASLLLTLIFSWNALSRTCSDYSSVPFCEAMISSGLFSYSYLYTNLEGYWSYLIPSRGWWQDICFDVTIAFWNVSQTACKTFKTGFVRQKNYFCHYLAEGQKKWNYRGNNDAMFSEAGPYYILDYVQYFETLGVIEILPFSKDRSAYEHTIWFESLLLATKNVLKTFKNIFRFIEAKKQLNVHSSS